MTIGNIGHYDGWPHIEPAPIVRSPKVEDFPRLEKEEKQKERYVTEN